MAWLVPSLVASNVVTVLLALFFLIQWRRSDRALHRITHDLLVAWQKHHKK